MSCSVGIVVPYFGELPASFKAWINSAIKNDSIDFHIVTDQQVFNGSSPNIFVHQLSFHEFQKLTANKLGVRKEFSPYKLCDFKPTYGDLFSHFLIDYDFWGYCDVDMILGDLRGELEKLGLFLSHDKIFDLGHLSLFKNTPAINKIYKSKFKGEEFWPYIRDSRVIWVFDEAYDYGMGGVNSRIEQAGFKLFKTRFNFFDVDPGYDGFIDIHNSPTCPSFFSLNNRTLSRHTLVGDCIEVSDIVYAHFQKREFEVNEFADGSGIIVPSHWGEITSVGEAERCLKKEYENDFRVRHFYSRWKKERSRRKKGQIVRELFQSPSSIRFVRSIL